MFQRRKDKMSAAKPDPKPRRRDVIATYELLLGRAPENDHAIRLHLDRPFVELVRTIAHSNEYLTRTSRSPFFFYNSVFDVAAVIATYDNPARQAKAGHIVNFQGVALNRDFVPFLKETPEVEPPPVPANWHADMSEFGAALRAVDLAHEQFTMIELGCGWGCWMNITGVAARKRGLAVKVIGIEGDEGHIGFAREALATNGFAEGEYALHHGIAAATGGVALFPKQDRAGESWGLKPVFGATPQETDDAIKSGRYDQLPMVALDTLIGAERKIDLLHIDIQGGEADLVRDSMPVLLAKVGYLVIGTHSREIEGRLMQDLLAAGWQLEIERPAISTIRRGAPIINVDGVQGWRNPRLVQTPVDRGIEGGS